MKLVTILSIFISTTMATRRVCRCTYNSEYSYDDTEATCAQVGGTMASKYCVTNHAQQDWSKRCVDQGNCWKTSG
ncbi:uncharacterized protein LY79DRAFT_639252 [Colletotrichum navitas]|uniref:Uncharacterized protein n=1 Tax=Colletotrichum navitas TaxID=681940 RepID=A0AAD8V0T5_9PEZI|nr:uncharacterized protein LY79DRAFT_639252 [Colletotrichum navitas]KAK1574648.1 hypothetical protein LY79DRAFT_639252 [Colletotrichum navitas]